jgi:hypothetical protein
MNYGQIELVLEAESRIQAGNAYRNALALKSWIPKMVSDKNGEFAENASKELSAESVKGLRIWQQKKN